MIREAYVYFCGQPPQVAKPVSEEALDFERKVEFRFRRWANKAYRRAQMGPQTKTPEPPEAARLNGLVWAGATTRFAPSQPDKTPADDATSRSGNQDPSMSPNSMPYELTPEFIQAKSELRKRFWPPLETPGYPESKEVAACAYMQKMAELHDGFLESLALSDNERGEYLKIAVHDTAEELASLLPELGKALADYRDFLLSRHFGFPDCQPVNREDRYSNLPVSDLQAYRGSPFAGPLLREFRPLAKVHEPKPLPPEELLEYLVKNYQKDLDITCRLDEQTWEYQTILDTALHGEESLVVSDPKRGCCYKLMACLHDLEAALFSVHRVHRALPTQAVIDFWRSDAVQQYMKESIEQIFCSQPGSQILTTQIRYEVNHILAAYVAKSMREEKDWASKSVRAWNDKEKSQYLYSLQIMLPEDHPLQPQIKAVLGKISQAASTGGGALQDFLEDELCETVAAALRASEASRDEKAREGGRLIEEDRDGVIRRMEELLSQGLMAPHSELDELFDKFDDAHRLNFSPGERSLHAWVNADGVRLLHGDPGRLRFQELGSLAAKALGHGASDDGWKRWLDIVVGYLLKNDDKEYIDRKTSHLSRNGKNYNIFHPFKASADCLLWLKRNGWKERRAPTGDAPQTRQPHPAILPNSGNGTDHHAAPGSPELAAPQGSTLAGNSDAEGPAQVQPATAASDLDEWRGRAAVLAGAITDLTSGSTNQSASQSAPGVSAPPAPAKKNVGTTGQEAQVPKESRKAKKPVRRNQKYEVIDKALQEVAESRPSTQEEILQSLDGRQLQPFVDPGLRATARIKHHARIRRFLHKAPQSNQKLQFGLLPSPWGHRESRGRRSP